LPLFTSYCSENDIVAGISLDNVPDNYLVFCLSASDTEELANNNGDINGNLWAIDATNLSASADNIFIKSPEKVSGTVPGFQMKVISDSGKISELLDITLQVTLVADGVRFDPTVTLYVDTSITTVI